MHWNVRRIAAIAGSLAVVGVGLSGAAPAFGLTIPFENYAVSGTLTPKKLNEPVTLPKHSTFNGTATFFAVPPTPGWGANVSGHMTVPPFVAELKLGGTVPTQVHTTFTEVGTSEGTISEAPAEDCPNPVLPGPCATMSVKSKAIIGMTELGLLGIGTPVECHTAEPLNLELTTHLTFEELSELGPHFSGTVTIPEIKCEGIEGLLVGPAITAVMSGPENPYAFYIAPREPSAPSALPLPAEDVTQVSAQLLNRVDPNGDPLTACKFEIGTTESYGTNLPCLPEASTLKRLYNGNFLYGVAPNLNPGTTYHYRITVTNAEGTTSSADETVKTLAASETPEYGRCVAQKHGEYTDGGCRTKAAKAGKGGYEWFAGPPSGACVAQKHGEYTDAGCANKSAKPGKGKFEQLKGPAYTTSGGPLTLETPGLATTVKCSSSAGGGEVTGVSTSSLHLTLSGCESGGKACTSEGPNSTPSGTSGVIDANLLDVNLLGNAVTAWSQLTSGEHSPYLAEFACEGTHYRVSGALAGIQRGDVGSASTASTTSFSFPAFPSGEQALETEKQSGESWSAASPTIATGSLSNTAASPTEIR